MHTSVIHTENLTRDFGSLRAVNHISFEVAPGRIFGFLGPNGSGKTTTIRLLLGLIKPTSGTASVMGQDIIKNPDEIRQVSGALLENTGLYERLSARDNLEFYGRVWHISQNERTQRMKELLTSLDLWQRKDEVISGWSKGMKQKLAIARTLFHRPQLIFLDEPTNGLDPVAAAELREYLADLTHRDGVTIFLTTHNLNEAEKLCDRVAVIRQGKIIASGSPADLQARKDETILQISCTGLTDSVINSLRFSEGIKQVTITQEGLLVSTASDFDASSLVQSLVQNGVHIQEMRKQQTSLEEAFLQLMENEQ